MSAFAQACRQGHPVILLALVGLLMTFGAWNINEMEKAMSEPKVLSEIYLNLKKSETGQKLIQRVVDHLRLANENELVGSLKLGDVSKTDAILTRHYDSKTGEEVRDRRITIYIRSDQDMAEMVLDLAHELAHASDGPDWDPYDPDLSPGKYIRASIEGHGGEVQAIEAECRVATDLKKQNLDVDVKRCEDYFRASQLDADLIRRDFYKVGEWKPMITAKLGLETKDLPDLSDAPAPLLSSTGKAPYPISLFNEYIQMTRMACGNSKKRLERIREERATTPTLVRMREPASVEVHTHEFLVKRCFRFETEI